MNRLFETFCFLLAAGLILSLPPCAHAAAISWTPVGASTDFNGAANWTPNATTGDDLTLDGAVAAQLGAACSFAPASLTIGSAANGELDTNDGGSLSLAGKLSLSPTSSNSTVNCRAMPN
jgi:hypothetical protein